MRVDLSFRSRLSRVRGDDQRFGRVMRAIKWRPRPGSRSAGASGASATPAAQRGHARRRSGRRQTGLAQPHSVRPPSLAGFRLRGKAARRILPGTRRAVPITPARPSQLPAVGVVSWPDTANWSGVARRKSAPKLEKGATAVKGQHRRRHHQRTGTAPHGRTRHRSTARRQTRHSRLKRPVAPS